MIISFLKFLWGLTRKGWHPVSKADATSRARICTQCPLRAMPSVPRMIVGDFALLAMKARRPGSGVHFLPDFEGHCTACGCSLPAKVWVPDEEVVKTSTPNQFPLYCWQVESHAKLA